MHPTSISPQLPLVLETLALENSISHKFSENSCIHGHAFTYLKQQLWEMWTVLELM